MLKHMHRHISLTRRQYIQLTYNSYTTHKLPPLQSHGLVDDDDDDHTIASMHSIPSNPCFSLLSLCRTVTSLKRIHTLLIVDGLTNDLSCSTKLVSLYGSFGYIKHARHVFDGMPDPDFYSFKVMIRWYFLNDVYKEIIGFYKFMRKRVREHDNVVFSIVLKACSELRDINEGRNVHCEIVKAGGPDSFVLTGLVDMYAKGREIESSRRVFDEIIDRKNVVSWTSMIAGYVQNDCAQDGLILFNRMREGLVDANQFTVGSLVTACTKLGALHQGKWVHGYVIKIGVELNSHLVTALLDMYVKCGSTRDARSVFDELCSIDLVSWTAMIVGYAQSGSPDKALKLFTDKKWNGVLPNCVTIASVLSACAQLGDSNTGKMVHSLGVKLGLEDPTVINALVDMYAKCHMIRDAQYIFETFSDKDVITWNSIISGYCLNGSAYGALQMFDRMRSDSISPDAVSLVNVFSACASLGSILVGSALHAYSIKQGLLSSSVYVGTALLNFYAKCGDAQSARMVFDGMGEKNTVTWSAMIGGYGMQGNGSGSLALFGDMLKEEVQPNEIVFTTILSACSHAGMVGEGWRYFNKMCQEYMFVPSMKHYACMVDLLARAGRLEEALDFMENMPVQPDISLYGAFLHGCGLYSRFDLGEVMIRRMLKSHPDKACYYVLMCNLYASDGRWGQVNQVRELMKQRGISKSPGCSLVDLDNGFSFSKVASLA